MALFKLHKKFEDKYNVISFLQENEIIHSKRVCDLNHPMKLIEKKIPSVGFAIKEVVGRNMDYEKVRGSKTRDTL